MGPGTLWSPGGCRALNWYQSAPRGSQHFCSAEDGDTAIRVVVDAIRYNDNDNNHNNNHSFTAARG